MIVTGGRGRPTALTTIGGVLCAAEETIVDVFLGVCLDAAVDDAGTDVVRDLFRHVRKQRAA